MHVYMGSEEQGDSSHTSRSFIETHLPAAPRSSGWATDRMAFIMMSLGRQIIIAAAGAALFLTSAADAQIASRLVTQGLTRPVYATHAPGDERRLFIVEKRGRIRILDLETETLNSDYFLNIESIVQGGTSTSDERGLLGLAFDPNYPENGYFYVCYTATAGSGDSYIRRYSRGSDADHATTTGALTIMSYDQPYTNHNGGFLEFGPDGFLYIFTGDGGSGGDPGNRAQDITSQRLGKVLRIDVSGSLPYAIPSDNPFVGIPGDDEIYAYGLRNPWRSSFDRETGDIWIADVGQNAREEVNFILAEEFRGANFGWKCREGQSTYSSSCGTSGPFFEPQIEYFHNASGGYSITGGYVYRGCAIPEIQGSYFYADYVLANFWSAVPQSNGSVSVQSRTADLRTSISGVSINQVSSFGEDARGELYIVSQAGRIFKIVPDEGSESCDPPPANDECSNALVAEEGVATFTTVEATDSPFEVPLNCSLANGPGLFSDVWFQYTSPAAGFLVVESCDSTFDSRIAIYDAACPDESAGVYACGDDECGDDSSVSTLVAAGQSLLIRIGSTSSGDQGEGRLAISLDPFEVPCDGDLDGDRSVGGSDLGSLLANWSSTTALDADLDGNGVIGGGDLGLMLSNWGPCP